MHPSSYPVLRMMGLPVGATEAPAVPVWVPQVVNSYTIDPLTYMGIAVKHYRSV